MAKAKVKEKKKPVKKVKAAKPTRVAKPARPAMAAKAAKPTKSVKAAKPVKKVEAKARPVEAPKKIMKFKPLPRPKPTKITVPVDSKVGAVERPRPSKRITGDLAAIRERLLSLLSDLRKEIDHEVRGASERDLAHINDTSDMATDAAEGDLALRIAESETVEASEIERAIEKIDNGTYGLCEVCNEVIPLERLQFLPFATQCVQCQELADIRKRKHNDDLDDLNTDGGDMSEE
jgi:RNA polymerase-binding protein DksA